MNGRLLPEEDVIFKETVAVFVMPPPLAVIVRV